MWMAVRLLTVCVTGLSVLQGLRSGVPSGQTAPSLPPLRAAANEISFSNVIAKSENPMAADEDGTKVVKVESIHLEAMHLAPLQAYDEAPPRQKREAHHRRHLHYRHWHGIKRPSRH